MPRQLDEDFFESNDKPKPVEPNPEPVEIVPVTRENVTIDIIIKALTAYVYCAGSQARTIERMAEQGYGIRYDQLKSWSTGEYATEYQNIRENFVKKSEAEMVLDIRDTIHQAQVAESLAIERVVERFNNPHTSISAKDASQAAFNLSRVKKENVDKLQTLLGRPTQIIEDRSAEQAIKKLIARRILKPMSADSDDGDRT